MKVNTKVRTKKKREPEGERERAEELRISSVESVQMFFRQTKPSPHTSPSHGQSLSPTGQGAVELVVPVDPSLVTLEEFVVVDDELFVVAPSVLLEVSVVEPAPVDDVACEPDDVAWVLAEVACEPAADVELDDAACELDDAACDPAADVELDDVACELDDVACELLLVVVEPVVVPLELAVVP